ncbi:arginase family protein [Candidatus Pacearchaeota archaeon]|nr:arginase family protein [Candidatus Pacearchaeota archaeon]
MQITKIKLVNSMGKTKGCELAPDLVIDELRRIGHNEKGTRIDFDQLNIREIGFDMNNLEEALFNIQRDSRTSFEKHFKNLFIGGDHNISYSVCKSFLKTEKNPLILIFDAHADCMQAGKEPTHEEWLRKLLEEEHLGSSNIVMISTRNIWKEEVEFIRRNKITIISMDVLQEDLHGVCDMLMERARSSSGFYVSIDIDCLDPAFAPGTGYIEPGGLSSRELIYMLKRLVMLDNFRGADIVEINPKKDINNMTVRLGAKLLSEMV